MEERLRFSIQTLDGEIYEDRDGGDDSSTASTACTAPSSLSLSSPPSCDSDFSFSGNLSEEEDEEEGDAHFKDASCGPFPPDGDTAAESLSSSSKKRKPISSETGVEREKLKLGRGCRLSDNIGDNISDDSKQSTKVGHIFTAVPDEEQTLNEVLYEHSDDLQSPHRRVAAVGPNGIDLFTHTRGKLRGETLPGWDTGAGTSRPSRRTHNNKRRR